MANNNIKPIIEVTLLKGRINLFTKKFKYEKIIEDKDTKLKLQLVIISKF
jgi:hypothetical protein